EQRLETQESRERAILDNTAALIRVNDRLGRFQFVNRQFTESFGISADEALGRTPHELFPFLVAEKLTLGDEDVLQKNQTPVLQEQAAGIQGPRPFVPPKTPLIDHDGVPAALATVSTDITDQILARDAEQQLQLARTVQQKLYPAASPLIPGFDVAG